MPRHSRTASSSLYLSRRRAGFTLIEVLIATAVTLLMMVSLAQIFKTIGDSMKQGRAALELNNRLQSVALRFRADLENLTAIPDPPADLSNGTGYIKYLDGSLTDSTPASISTAISRFGDVDDIFMGTVRAGDVWFTGKVPRYFITQTDPVAAADFTMVTIASQHAEVVAFIQPVVTNVGNPSRDTSFYLTSTPNGALAFQDTNGDLFPDGFRLHYRTLLVRPDLNLSTGLTISSLGNTVAPAGVLPAARANSGGSPVNWTLAQPQGGGLPSPLCDMAAAHQQCDLSIRRVYGSGTAAFDFVAANSLDDLVDPANRFAHFQAPVPGTVSTTMPLLALGPALAVNSADPSGTLVPAATAPFVVGSGFLHPAYALYGTRAGEDLLASDVLAFDIKGYDPGVPLLASFGPDGASGVAGRDDDGNGVTDGAAAGTPNLEIGWAGSDDLVLSPNDPGYAAALGSTIVGTGDYVDLCWGRKVVMQIIAAGGTPPVAAAANLWSPLSGFSQNTYATASVAGRAFAFTNNLYKSGLVITTTAPSVQVLQPSYDTWLRSYEGDGFLQAELPGRVGNLRIDGGVDLYGFGGSNVANALPVWRRSSFDAGTDGIDNNPVASPGVDDITELETSPPFPIKLQGLRVSIRMEDPTTRQVKQMSVSKEFVTQ